MQIRGHKSHFAEKFPCVCECKWKSVHLKKNPGNQAPIRQASLRKSCDPDLSTLGTFSSTPGPGLAWGGLRDTNRTNVPRGNAGIGWFCFSAWSPLRTHGMNTVESKSKLHKEFHGLWTNFSKTHCSTHPPNRNKCVCMWSLASGMPGSTLCLLHGGETADLPEKLLDDSLKHTSSYREGSCLQRDSMLGIFA